LALRWSDFITPSTLQLAPLVELLLEPVACLQLHAELKLGLHEALVNAVRHGNNADPTKCLRVRRIESAFWLIWQVQDEGAGFDFHRSPEQCRLDQRTLGQLPLDRGATAGRGLFLIHQCFDDVRWSPKGNRVQLAITRRRMGTVAIGRGWGSLDR
jgi:serine/threonine-protein kinase RsbW/non-specific serine/threonine protein kinase